VFRSNADYLRSAVCTYWEDTRHHFPFRSWRDGLYLIQASLKALCGSAVKHPETS